MREPAPDSPIGMDPYYRFSAPHPMLIRITGGQRFYTTDNLTTFYSWTLAYHPQTPRTTLARPTFPP
jgi:hypothetical protein